MWQNENINSHWLIPFQAATDVEEPSLTPLSPKLMIGHRKF